MADDARSDIESIKRKSIIAELEAMLEEANADALLLPKYEIE
jgi:nicotinamide riboside kinase